MRMTPKQTDRIMNMVRQYPDFIEFLEFQQQVLLDTMVQVDDGKLTLMQGKARWNAELIKLLKSLNIHN